MAIKVFISYAHESEGLSNKVLKLSDHLRSHGIDSEIDQYEEAPAEGWPKWMMKQVQQADFVLVCCSKLFYERANDFSDSEDGLGVKWETSLILQQLYNLSTNNKKFIPIVLNNKNTAHIPLPLQPYTYYDVSIDGKKKLLVNRLLGTSESKRPPLGEITGTKEDNKPLAKRERKSMFLSSIIDIDLWNKAKWKGMAMVTYPTLSEPPIAGFLFENEKAGEEIFSKLKTEFGEIDNDEEIRLSFIEKISETKPLDYKVHFGSSLDIMVNKFKKYGLEPNETLLITISRFHEMNPPNDPSSLTLFKHAYSHFKRYYITNIVTKGGQLMPSWSNMVEKKSVLFRTKKEVIKNKINDGDYVAIKNKINDEDYVAVDD